MEKITELCIASVKRFFVEKYTYRASALAFTTVLALVPLLSVIFFLISKSPLLTKLVNLAENYIYNNFMPATGLTVQAYLDSFVEKAHSLPAFGITFLVVTAVMLIITIAHTLTDIWQVPKKHKKVLPWVVYWLVLSMSPILIGISLLISSYVFSLSWLIDVVNHIGINIYLFTFFSLLFNGLIFSTLYIISPNCPINIYDGLLGGVIAAVLFEIAKKGFSFYISNFPSYTLIYGVVAIIPIFLIWLYISWVIILLGALVASERYHDRMKNRGIIFLK